MESPTLHAFLDYSYGSDGQDVLRTWLSRGVDLDERKGKFLETPLHVAVRRRRLDAVEILLDAGAEINVRTAGGKSAFVHAVRRRFDEISHYLADRGRTPRLCLQTSLPWLL